jgi:hypothetical protein
MDDYNYIEEVFLWLNQLQEEIKNAPDNIERFEVFHSIRMIVRKCNNLELYTRALRDKLSEYDCADTYDPSTTVLGPGSDIDNWI